MYILVEQLSERYISYGSFIALFININKYILILMKIILITTAP